MQTNATPFASKLGAIVPPTEEFFANKCPPRDRLYGCDERPYSETLLSLRELHERLGLLAQLELPCSIFIASPPRHLRNAVMKNIDLCDGQLRIGFDGFILRLSGIQIGAIRLVNRSESNFGIMAVEIHHIHGMLYVRIQPLQDGVGGAVWRDIMDNPSLSLV
ncbi:MAG: hypothetical protein PHE55_00670 [Methylococcaceae bacterium]|nr:hypothetical protein [Methylococcaceae bacterium]